MILAVDLGSTSFKAGVFDRSMTQAGYGAHILNYRYSEGGKVEIHVAEVVAAFRNAIGEALQTASIDIDSIQAVTVTSQAQTFTVLDHADNPRIPFISWQDMRAVAARALPEQESALSNFGQHASFGECLPGLLISKLRYLQDTRSGLVKDTDRVLMLPAFLAYLCTGTPVIDTNLAAMSGLYSLRIEDWWPAAMTACRVQQKQLPALLPIGSVANTTCPKAKEFGLPEGIPFVLAGNDQTAGAYGAKIHETGSLLITLGTAHVAYVCTSKLAPLSDRIIIRGPYPEGMYYRMVAADCGGNILNWTQTVIAGCATNESLFTQAARAEPSCRGLVFEADVPLGAGAWRNIGLHHTPAEFSRSVLESLAKRMGGMIRRLGVQLNDTKVLAAGGGSASPLWIHILSEIDGTPIAVTQSTPLYGAAAMAWRAL